MKAIVLFHSVCGNTYYLAESYAAELAALGVEADLFRVRDTNYERFAALFPAAQSCREALRRVPVLENPLDVQAYDYIFFGAPTYFGNVSGPVKLYMDALCDFWPDAKLYGKKFGCFTAASTTAGGGQLCLQAMNTFALHMGMTLLAVPANLQAVAQPAYGFIHYSGETAETRPDEKLRAAIREYLARSLALQVK